MGFLELILGLLGPPGAYVWPSWGLLRLIWHSWVHLGVSSRLLRLILAPLLARPFHQRVEKVMPPIKDQASKPSVPKVSYCRAFGSKMLKKMPGRVGYETFRPLELLWGVGYETFRPPELLGGVGYQTFRPPELPGGVGVRDFSHSGAAGGVGYETVRRVR